MLLLPPGAVHHSLKAACSDPSSQVPQLFDGPGGHRQPCGTTKTPSVILYPLISLQQRPTLAPYKQGLGGTFPVGETQVTTPTTSPELQPFPMRWVK